MQAGRCERVGHPRTVAAERLAGRAVLAREPPVLRVVEEVPRGEQAAAVEVGELVEVAEPEPGIGEAKRADVVREAEQRRDPRDEPDQRGLGLQAVGARCNDRVALAPAAGDVADVGDEPDAADDRSGRDCPPVGLVVERDVAGDDGDAQCLAGLRHPLDRLGELEVPPLVIWGELDRVIPSRHAVAALTALPTAWLEIMEGVGHVPQVEAAPAFAEIINRWLLSIPGP